MKKKSMILAVASLGSMAIIGTGFAGWVISADAKAEGAGVITAYEVKDQRLKVSEGKWGTSVSDTDKSGKIVFGSPKDKTTTNHWFTFDKVEDEVLTNTFEFTVASGDASDEAPFEVTSTIEIISENKTDWEKAITDQIVAQPKATVSGDSAAKLAGKNAVTVKIDLTFNWGDHFKIENEVKNPYHFYNAHTAIEEIRKSEDGKSSYTYGDDAAEFMAKFNQITLVNFKLSIVVARADSTSSN